MTRRPRRLAGIFALAALGLSLAETVLASTCAAMSGMDMSTAMADSTVEMPSTDCPLTATAGQTPDGGRDGPDCPLNPALGQGCNALASLPSLTVDVSEPAPHDVTTLGTDARRPDLLLSHALFHPPRA